MAVNTESRPPSDLLVCPVAPEGFPVDQEATMTPPVRAAAMRLVTAYAGVVAQVVRLIQWHDQTACGRAGTPARGDAGK